MIFKGCQLLKLPWPISTKIHHLFYDYRANCFTNGRPKTARSMLSDRCPACLFSVLSVTLVYCGQTVGRMMKLGMEVGLGPRLHCVIDGNPAPPPQRGTRNIRPMSVVAKQLDGLRCHLVRRYASAQATLCWMGTQLPPPKG